jgi:hypothetical protein
VTTASRVGRRRKGYWEDGIVRVHEEEDMRQGLEETRVFFLNFNG